MDVLELARWVELNSTYPSKKKWQKIGHDCFHSYYMWREKQKGYNERLASGFCLDLSEFFCDVLSCWREEKVNVSYKRRIKEKVKVLLLDQSAGRFKLRFFRAGSVHAYARLHQMRCEATDKDTKLYLEAWKAVARHYLYNICYLRGESKIDKNFYLHYFGKETPE